MIEHSTYNQKQVSPAELDNAQYITALRSNLLIELIVKLLPNYGDDLSLNITFETTPMENTPDSMIRVVVDVLSHPMHEVDSVSKESQ